MLAGLTADPPTEEAKSRAAISRTYYAAFCQARSSLEYKDKDTAIATMGDSGIHGYVINQFRDSHDRDRKIIGRNLNLLRIERNKADYQDTYPLQQSWSFTVGSVLAYADTILSLLEKLPPKPKK
ncbi:MAG: HEPN domain-containing protein [Aggregatilineales bacterium]